MLGKETRMPLPLKYSEVMEKIHTTSFRIGYSTGTLIGVTYLLYKKGEKTLSQRVARR